MKQPIVKRTICGIALAMTLIPTLVMAEPAGPGGGDPYATPVNGYVAFVAVIAFVYGAYRMYQLAKNNRFNNTNL